MNLIFFNRLEDCVDLPESSHYLMQEVTHVMRSRVDFLSLKTASEMKFGQ